MMVCLRMLTVHPLNVALLMKPGVLQSWFDCKFVSRLLTDSEQLGLGDQPGEC